MLYVYLTDKRTPKYEIEQDITELWNLTESLGDAGVTDIFIQKGIVHRDTYIGSGKTEEIIEYLKKQPVDVVMVNGNLTPTQKFNLTKTFWDINPRIVVWDRIDLILAIFSRHAQTQEAKLQIELAYMRYAGPSIFGMGKILSRQGGGIGTRGIGETNTELMKRHWKREIKRVTTSLNQLVSNRSRQIDNRRDLGIRTVALVGYTNAGKTSLFNALTRKDKKVNDALFVTLDSVVGKLYSPGFKGSVLISDSIGFIKALPPDLISAFKSTLMESIHADLIAHIIDVSDREYIQKIGVVNKILEQLRIPEKKVIYVFNKIDAAPDINRLKISEVFQPNPVVFISVKNKQGISGLLKLIMEKLSAVEKFYS